jgi:hypothetical protein
LADMTISPEGNQMFSDRWDRPSDWRRTRFAIAMPVVQSDFY